MWPCRVNARAQAHSTAVVDRRPRQSSVEIYICTAILSSVVRKSLPFARMGRWSSASARSWLWLSIAAQLTSRGGKSGTQCTAINNINSFRVYENRSLSRRRTTVTAVWVSLVVAVTSTDTLLKRVPQPLSRAVGGELAGDYGWAAVESNAYFNYFYYCYLPTRLHNYVILVFLFLCWYCGYIKLVLKDSYTCYIYL